MLESEDLARKLTQAENKATELEATSIQLRADARKIVELENKLADLEAENTQLRLNAESASLGSGSRFNADAQSSGNHHRSVQALGKPNGIRRLPTLGKLGSATIHDPQGRTSSLASFDRLSIAGVVDPREKAPRETLALGDIIWLQQQGTCFVSHGAFSIDI